MVPFPDKQSGNDILILVYRLHVHFSEGNTRLRQLKGSTYGPTICLPTFLHPKNLLVVEVMEMRTLMMKTLKKITSRAGLASHVSKGAQ